MSTSKSPPLLFEELSVELWERIFLLTSPRDILRLSLVRDVVGIIDSGRSLNTESSKGQPRLP